MIVKICKVLRKCDNNVECPVGVFDCTTFCNCGSFGSIPLMLCISTSVYARADVVSCSHSGEFLRQESGSRTRG